MSKKHKWGFGLLIGLAILEVVLIVALILKGHNTGILSPKGTIAAKQRDLILLSAFLSAIVVIPVYGLAFFISWRYRETNQKARYDPEWDHNRWLELTWWAIPGLIITILGIIAWNSSHSLDPHRPIDSTIKPMTIQVVALQWKWLFIYPQQQIASVNYVQFPVNQPINFEITADAPMNSFWIPRLGGQIYAMSGMSTHLQLMASEAGSYNGSSANISGSGFASMKFTAQASSKTDFEHWTDMVRGSREQLDWAAYITLAKPSEKYPVDYYSVVDTDLYTKVVHRYKQPASLEGALE